MSGTPSDHAAIAAPFQWFGLYPSSPEMKAPPAPPNPNTDAATAAKLQEAELSQAQSRGRASTILTGGQGLSDRPTTASSVLLGSG